MVGSSGMITPKATMDAIGPSFTFFACWMLFCGCAFLFFGFETGRKSITAVDKELAGKATMPVGE